MATVTLKIDTTSTSNVTSYASAAFAAAVGDVIVVFVTAPATVAAASVTDSLAEVTFSKVASALKASSADTIYCFISNGFAKTTGSRTVTFDCTGDAATGAIVTAYTVSGMSKAGLAAVRQSAVQSNQAAAGTPAPAFTNSCLTGNPTLGFVGNAATAAPSMTPPTNWTEGSDSAFSTPSTGQETVFRASGFTGTTVTWGSSSATAFGSVIIELDASSSNVDDDSACSWWGGVQKCFAGIAIATALSATVLSTAVAQQVQQYDKDEIPAGFILNASGNSWAQPARQFAINPGLYSVRYAADVDDLPIAPASNQQDEDYWISGVPPGQAINRIALPIGDTEEIPAASLFGQPDEDFWRNSVSAVPASNLWPQQWAFDVQESAGSLFGQFDEDFWRSGVAPIWWTNLYPQQANFDTQEPSGSLFGQADEDLWINPVFPVQARNYVALPIGDPEELPAASFYGQPEELYWQNPVIPQVAILRVQLLLGDQDDVFPATIIQDEDYWQNSVAPAQSSLYRSSLLGDQEEIPSGALLAGEPDEDYWVNPTRPLAPFLYQALPYLFESADYVPAIAPQIDEDIWRNPTAPVQASLYQRLPLGDVEELPAGRFFGQDDEDFWTNAVAPVPAKQYVALPLGDPYELPAGSMFGEFDEDLWVNPVPPVVAGLYRSPVFSDPEEVPGALLKSPAVDEYYWQNSVRPVPTTFYQQLPYRFEAVEIYSAQSGTAQPSGLSLVAAENDPTAIVQSQGRGGTRKPGRMYQRPAGSISEPSALAQPAGLSLRVNHGNPLIPISAIVQARGLPMLRASAGQTMAKGIRNPTDEELIAILMGA